MQATYELTGMICHVTDVDEAEGAATPAAAATGGGSGAAAAAAGAGGSGSSRGKPYQVRSSSWTRMCRRRANQSSPQLHPRFFFSLQALTAHLLAPPVSPLACLTRPHTTGPRGGGCQGAGTVP